MTEQEATLFVEKGKGAIASELIIDDKRIYLMLGPSDDLHNIFKESDALEGASKRMIELFKDKGWKFAKVPNTLKVQLTRGTKTIIANWSFVAGNDNRINRAIAEYENSADKPYVERCETTSELIEATLARGEEELSKALS